MRDFITPSKTITNTKRSRLLFLLLLGIVQALIMVASNVQAADLSTSAPVGSRVTTTINVQSTVEVANARKLGINIGTHDRFGASQLLKNVIINPGFEAAEYGQIFHTSAGATGTRIQQENWRISFNPATSLPADFWNGASYEITYGPAKGRTGTISDFTHEDDKYTYYLDSNGTAPEQYDTVLVTTTKDDIFYPGIPKTTPSGQPILAHLDSAESHSGQQSIRLSPPDVVWRASHEYYMDTLYQTDPSAGQLIKFEGNWCLDYWAKAQQAGDAINMYMWRVNGNGNFLFNTPDQLLADTWQHYSFQFNIDPNDNRNEHGGRGPNTFIPPIDPDREIEGSSPAVTLGFRPKLVLDGADNVLTQDIWIDDVELYPCDDTNPTVFSDTYVNLLKELQPGTIRDWGSAQLGASLDNQLAIPFERKTTWHNPRLDPTPKDWQFSLPEFLELAQEVGANPWYVIPPTFSDQEMTNLAEYLTAPATSAHPYAQLRQALGQSAPWTDVFDTIHLEYGNEMWGSNDGSDPFLGATAKGGTRLGQLADLRFEAFDLGVASGVTNLNRIIGGQINHVFTQREIEDNSNVHDSIALSPYFGYNIDFATNDEELYYPSYARVFQDIASGNVFDQIQAHINAVGNGTELAIYE
ncbi:MAG TPA: hypothetical protein ENJ56_01515, partial [Anaerolineae bacterium]|nr:hypothetical protein [Anaerolineae bacterium]